MSEKDEQAKLKGLADNKLTEAEMAMHQRVYEMAIALGAEPDVAMTKGTMAIIGQRLYGGKESVHRHLKEGWARIYEETERVKATQSIACPPADESSIILTGPSGIIKH